MACGELWRAVDWIPGLCMGPPGRGIWDSDVPSGLYTMLPLLVGTIRVIASMVGRVTATTCSGATSVSVSTEFRVTAAAVTTSRGGGCIHGRLRTRLGTSVIIRWSVFDSVTDFDIHRCSLAKQREGDLPVN